MDMETNIVYLDSGDRDYAEELSGQVFSSLEELKGRFASDSINLIGVQRMHEFQNEWNDTDGVIDGLRKPLNSYMISYVYIVK
jgi:hypothetical protein